MTNTPERDTMNIQEEFERCSENQAFKFNKLDLTKDIYDNSYTDHVNRIAFTYYLAGYATALPPLNLKG
jgi:hypothetical protein